ncbi:hypothetical protein D3C84_724800 [compost metagenome]
MPRSLPIALAAAVQAPHGLAAEAGRGASHQAVTLDRLCTHFAPTGPDVVSQPAVLAVDEEGAAGVIAGRHPDAEAGIRVVQTQPPHQPGIRIELQAHLPLPEQHIVRQAQRSAVPREEMALARYAAAAGQSDANQRSADAPQPVDSGKMGHVQSLLDCRAPTWRSFDHDAAL